MEQTVSSVVISEAVPEDIDALWALEQRCFSSDRLSRRRMRYYAQASHAEFVVARHAQHVVGYALLLCRRGTQLTRLYSIAVDPDARGLGVAGSLLRALEERALLRGKPFMRLEVAVDNQPAIALYKKMGFKQFGMYSHYYENDADALRMQKALHWPAQVVARHPYPWYRQTTEFTCGPAALMMAMAALEPDYTMTQHDELAIWRQATTIFMTSGHGGCHPIGLALAAQDKGFVPSVWLNQPLPLFTDGVRSEHKKHIVELVELEFAEQAAAQAIQVQEFAWQLDDLAAALAQNHTVVCLISTYQFDKRKAPHWVVVTGIDDTCVYIHDPDPLEDDENPVNFQHIPVAREDFLRLASYGKRKIRTALVLAPA